MEPQPAPFLSTNTTISLVCITHIFTYLFTVRYTSTNKIMESTPEQTTEGLLIVRVLAAVLDRLIYTNASLSSRNSNSIQDPATIITKFHAMKPPGISIQHYLERYVTYHHFFSAPTCCCWAFLDVTNPSI